MFRDVPNVPGCSMFLVLSTPKKHGHYPIQYNNNNEFYLRDHTNAYSIEKAMFRNQNYNTGQLRYFDNNLSRTSKQAEIYFMNCILIK